jgi:hypothetical protein
MPKPIDGANAEPKPMASPPHPNPLPHAGEGANVMPKPINDEACSAPPVYGWGSFP